MHSASKPFAQPNDRTLSLDPQQYTDAIWTLRMLYAPQNGQPAVSIESTRRLFCGLRIAADTLEEHCNTKPALTFETGKYNPYLPDFDDTLNALVDAGIVRVTTGDPYDTLHLIPDGINFAADLYDELTTLQQDILEWTRNRHINSQLAALLSFCYLQYND